MNELLKDIEDLETIAHGVRHGVSKNLTLDLIEKMIEIKQVDISIFETQMEMEFMKDGINRS
jgi:hypothetical protein|tara:strand:+ start:124 stop:309 length:186 start_codon:yes stop_codon:yes gene_type:complete